MSTTQIPPANPAPPARRPEGGDLYDARYWESAYRDINDAPTLLLKLQDDLDEARRREAFWISVVVHLVVVLLLWNSQKLTGLLPRRTVVAVSPSLSNQKDLTYLELPPDEQKVSKRPNTNIESDKDRIATSHAPQLDRQELKKILDASRPGRPGPSGAELRNHSQRLLLQLRPRQPGTTAVSTTTARSKSEPSRETADANTCAVSQSSVWQRRHVRRFRHRASNAGCRGESWWVRRRRRRLRLGLGQEADGVDGTS